MENWKKVKGFERYEVSDKGNVRTTEFVVETSRRIIPYHSKLLSQFKSKDGYWNVAFNVDKKRYVRKVHRLVYEAFNGELKEGMVIDHINHISTDNRAENLQQVTNFINLTKDKKNKNGVGVYEQRGRYISEISLGGEKFYLGVFDTPELAQDARTRARTEYDTNGTLPKRSVKRNTFKNGYKVCPCCGEEKPVTDYYKNKYGGYQGKCKSCLRKYDTEYRKKL